MNKKKKMISNFKEMLRLNLLIFFIFAYNVMVANFYLV